MKIIHIIGLSLTLAIGACTTTKVQDVRYVKGKLLKNETSEPVYLKTEPEIGLSTTEISLRRKDIYQIKTIKIYEKIQSTKLNTKGTAMTDSPFWAIIGTPGALILDVLSLGTMGATADIWTKNENSWKDVKKKLEDDFIVDESNKYTNKFSPLKDEPIAIYLNDKYVTKYFTNSSGKVAYNLSNVLLMANLRPQNLINNQGLTLEVKYSDSTKTQKFANKDIPEQFFATQFSRMKASLMERKGRFDNCDFIAANKREFFECYYQ